MSRFISGQPLLIERFGLSFMNRESRMEILVGENGPPNRPNLDTIRLKTPNPKPHIKRDSEVSSPTPSLSRTRNPSNYLQGVNHEDS